MSLADIHGITSEFASDPAPFRWIPGQISSLLFAYFAETVVSRFFYPFLPQLVDTLPDVPTDGGGAGYYLGALVGVESLTAAVSVLLWGALSDRIGRKSILLINSLGLAVGVTIFGLSKTLATLIVSKVVEGCFEATKPTVKTALAESSLGDDNKMALYFSFMPIIYASGSVVGSFIGGSFSRPQLWPKYPYLLPCLITAFVCLISFCSTAVLFQETLPSRQVLNSSVHTSPFTSPALQSAALPDDTEETPLLRPPSPPPLRIQTPQLLIVLLNYAIFTFLALSLTATFSLFLHLPIGAGGLSLNPATIGLILGVVGILIGLIQAVFFSKVYKKWGCKKVFRVSVVVFVLIYACMPVMAAISANAGGYTPLVWVLLVFLLFLQAVPPAGFSCMYIFITRASPSPSSLGRTHAIAQTVFSIMGALGPASATSLLAASLQYNVLGGALVYVIMVALAVVGWGVSDLLPDVNGEASSEGERESGVAG